MSHPESTPQPPSRLSIPEIDELVADVVEEIQAAGPIRPSLVRVRWSERQWVLKDYRRCWWIARVLMGPFQLWRERRAYRRLLGVAGIPEMLELPEKAVLAVAFIEGDRPTPRTLGRAEGFLSELEQLVDEMHQRGVVHLDLRSKSNLLVDREGHPWVFDFGSSVLAARLPVLGRLLRSVDLGAVTKCRRRLAPDSLNPDQVRHLAKQDRWSRFAPRLTRMFLKRDRRQGRSPDGETTRDAGDDINADSAQRP